MPDEMQSDLELNQLIDAAGPEVGAIVDLYEPYEEAYRQATSSIEVRRETVDTGSLPLSAVVATTSAR
jgi:hypothetical protein